MNSTATPQLNNGQALSPTQIQQVRVQSGIQTPTPTDSQWSYYDSLQKPTASQNTAQPSPSTPAPEENMGQMDADQLTQAGNKVTSSISTAGQRINQDANGTIGGETKAVGDTLEGLGGASAGIIQGVFAPVTASIQKIEQMASDNKGVQAAATSKPVSDALDAINNHVSQVSDWMNKNLTPRQQEDLQNAITVGATVAGGELGPDMSISDAASTVKGVGSDATNAIKTGTQGVKTAITGTPEEQAAAQSTKATAQTAKQTQASIDAVNPDLSGKKLTTGYKQTVTGGRNVTSGSVFKEQGLTPDQQSINLGTRLTQDIPLTDGTVSKGISLGKDPVKNLDTLGSSMEDTENKLDNHSDMDTPLNKADLSSKLETLKNEKPQDFIGDSGKIYDNVVSYAQKVAQDAEDTIRGGRSARTAFDNEAQRKFPTAFKNGTIDTSTPAGSAIKTVRNAFNEHIYNTAPNGSELQKLIGREADIFRATDNIAPKAAAGHGNTWLGQVAKDHPLLGKYLKYGAIGIGGALGGDAVSHATGL